MTVLRSCPTPPAEWRWWLALREVRGIGPVVYQALLRVFGHPRALFDSTRQELECAGVRPELAEEIAGFRGWPKVEEEIRRIEQAGATLVTWDDPRYPSLLRQIHDPPPFLYMAGELQGADDLAVAVVGSRRPTAYGLRVARQLATELSDYGFTVVSGLARGIDAAAHWAALKRGGRTLAVLGSGIDVVYPPEHGPLFRQIALQGAVLSELPMGSQPDAENFPVRNRIISGLARGTIVVEAAEKSGSLITAYCAAEQGREVFAVPGPIAGHSQGCHKLLRSGAKLTESARDVIEEIAPQLARARQAEADLQLPLAAAQVVELLRAKPAHIDELAMATGQSTSDLLALLLELELKGVVQQLPGKCFALVMVDGGEVVAKK